MTAIAQERYLFTIEDFDPMLEAGIVTEDDRVEFIDGELIRMSTVGGRHVNVIVRATGCFILLGDTTIRVSIQNPLRIQGRASFLPDLAVLRAAPEAVNVPTDDEVLLIIEVSSPSLRYDRDTKLPRYAAANIPEAWIFNLVDDQIERHTDPRDGAYQRVEVARRGERFASTVLPALTFDVATLLGPPGPDDE